MTVTDPKRIAALRKQGGVYKMLSEITPGTQDVLDMPTPAWLDREYPYVAPPDEGCTLKELDYLISLIPLRAQWGPFIKAADEDMAGLFVTLCSELGAPCDRQSLDVMSGEATILITKMKWLYNRPRPYQIAAKHNRLAGQGRVVKPGDFWPMGSKTAHSPAYPSGHTIQAYLLASRLSEAAPQHRKAFMDLAHAISFSRAVGGYHWPSDLTFAKDVFRHVVMPHMPSSVRVAKTFTINEGQPIWYGKYKNKKGIIDGFSTNDKGDTLITVEQVPNESGRKQPKEMKLFKIRPRQEGKQASAHRVAAKYKDKKEVPKSDGKGTTTVYEYGPRQVAKRHKDKAVRIEALRKKMADLRQKARGDLTASDPETRLTALAICLMDETYERVGNEKSAEEGHFGVTNWTAGHVTLSDKAATIKYTGKSGVKHEKKVTNARVLAALRKAIKGKGKDDKILCDGDECSILAKDVNAYLKPYEITAKDIRGLHANEEMKHHLKAQRKAGPADLPRSRKEKDEILKAEFQAALDLAAAAVGHEPSTLRSQYLVPSMEESYVHDGTVLDRLDKVATLSDTEHEDREAERLVKKSPKKKPPRLDRERRIVQDKDNERDPDEDQEAKDTSNRSRDASARVALRYLLAKKPPHLIRMWNTEAEQVVEVSPETAEKDKSKYKKPSEEQLESFERERGTGGDSGGGEKDTPDPKAVARNKQKADAKKVDDTATARAEIDKLTEGIEQEWDRSALQTAVKKLLDTMGVKYTDDQIELLEVADKDDIPDILEGVEGYKKALGDFQRSQKDMKARGSESISQVVGKSLLSEVGDTSTTMLLDIAEAVKANKDQVADALVGGDRNALRIKATEADKVLKAIGSKKPPTATEVAKALLAKRTAEVLDDPSMLDPSKPLTDLPTKPLDARRLQSDKYIRDKADQTVAQTRKYRGMDKDDRDKHAEKLKEMMASMEANDQAGSERYESAKAQVRAIAVASALEDGDDAKGVTPEYQAILKAADKQGRLDEMIALSFTGKSVSGVDAQTAFRRILRDTPVAALGDFMDDTNPYKEVVLEGRKLLEPPSEAGEADWSSVIDEEGKEMIRQDMEDMILAGIAFTDLDEVRKGGKTTGKLRKDKQRFPDAQKSIASKMLDYFAEMRKKMKEALGTGEGGKKASLPTGDYDFAPWGAELGPTL